MKKPITPFLPVINKTSATYLDDVMRTAEPYAGKMTDAREDRGGKM
jgi:hypothetical protein